MKPLHTVRLDKRRLLTLLLIAVLALSLLFAGITAARYVLQQRESGIADAQNFYFTSDLLMEPSDTARYYIDPGSGSFDITLFNSADSQRITSADIPFKVAVTGGTASSVSGTLTGGHSASALLTVTPDANASEITVTVSTSAPFVKTLSASFVPALGNVYTIQDTSGDTAAVLTMTCTDSAKEMILTLPAGIIPDATDHRVSASSGGGYIFHSPGYGIYSLTLLKSDTSVALAGSNVPFAGTIDLVSP